jgi:hypothetical protein
MRALRRIDGPAATPHVPSFAGGRTMSGSEAPRRLSTVAMMKQRDVAEVFNCTDRTIRNWVKKGWLVQHCVGKSVFYRRVDVERLAGLSPE